MSAALLGLGKDAIVYGVGSALSRFLGLLALPFFTSYLSPDDYGALAMLAMLTTFAQPVFSLGLNAAMGPSYFAGTSAHAKSEAVWTASALTCVSSAILLSLAWTVPDAIAWLTQLPKQYIDLVPLSLTSCAMAVLTSAHSQRVQFERRALLYVSVTVAATGSGLLSMLILVGLIKLGARGMVIGQLVGAGVSLCAFAMSTVTASAPRVSRSTAKSLLRVGIPMIPSFGFVFVLMQSSRYILELERGLGAVGILSVGVAIGSAVSIFSSGVSTAWFPFFMKYKDNQEDAAVLFGKVFTLFTFAAGIIAVTMFLLARPIVETLTQSPFHRSSAAVGWTALAFIMQGAFSMFLPGAYYSKHLPWISVLQGLAAVLGTTATWLLVSAWDMEGAAIGIFVGNALMAALMYFWNYMHRSTYFQVKYEWSRIGAIVLLGVLLIGTNSLINARGLLTQVIVATALAAAGLTVLAWILSSAERKMLVQLVRTTTRGKW